MNQSPNSTLILDMEQKTADTLGNSKNKRGTEEIIDERNTLLLNTDEEVQNTTLNDWVAMLSGTPSKNSADLTHKRQISGRKIKHHLPHSPQRNTQDLPRSFLEMKRPTKKNIYNITGLRDHPNAVTSSSPKASESVHSLDFRKFQVRGKCQGPAVIKLPETLDILDDLRPRTSDIWIQNPRTSDPKSPQSLETKIVTPGSATDRNNKKNNVVRSIIWSSSDQILGV